MLELLHMLILGLNLRILKFELDKGVPALVSDPRCMVLLLKNVRLYELGNEADTAFDKAEGLPPVLLETDNRVLQEYLMRLYWLHSVVCW